MTDRRTDDPWTFDLADRISLATSILGHADEHHWQQARDRALLALQGATIDEIRTVTN